MQLIRCQVAGCLQSEVWNSTKDVGDHVSNYHPDHVEWKWSDADHTKFVVFFPDEMPEEDVELVNEVLAQRYAFETPRWKDLYKPGSFEATFAEIFQEAFDLLVERQRKYGPENIRQLGLWGVFDRFADDKVNRIRRAFNGTIRKGVLEVELTDSDFDDESLEDALFDSANYPLIMVAQKRDLWGRPLQEDM